MYITKQCANGMGLQVTDHQGHAGISSLLSFPALLLVVDHRTPSSYSLAEIAQ